MAETSAMPAPFRDLTALAAHWGLATENQRNAVRWSSTAGDFAALYEGVAPRLKEILVFLGRHQPTAMPPDVRNLYYLACAFAESAPHHELYGGSPNVPHSFDARRFVPQHGDQVS
jgi:hypothetical protein